MIGLDLLGLASKKWKVGETLKALPQGIAIGLFADDTFGPLAIPNTVKLLESGKVNSVRAQLHWDYGHKIVPMDKLRALLPKWESLAKKYPQVKFYLSHSCEYKESSVVEIKKRTSLVQQLAPSCISVQTPMKSPIIPDGGIVEVHGQQPGKAGQLCSTDGEALFNMDAEKWNNASQYAAIRFAWGERCNGAEAHNTLKPQQRTAFPDAKYLKSLLRLMAPKGIPPTPVFDAAAIVPVKKPLLMKSHAEDNPGDSVRDNRPLLMLKQKTPEVSIVTFDNKVIGKLKYFAPYPPDLYRFYSGLPGAINLYGYEIAEKAAQISGSEWCWVRQGKKYFGPIHFAFRVGYFQT